MVKELVTMPVGSTELSISGLKNQVLKIQQVMKSVMQEGVHYGKVPGVANTFLFKAGAEKLCMTFRLLPKYKVDKTIQEKGHITYEVTCELYHASGAYVGSGLGIASTLEKKYRYRYESFPTKVEVPSAWWDAGRDNEKLVKILKNNNAVPKTAAALKKEGLEIGVGKVGKKWHVVYKKSIENPDIADVYNTVIKMAKKRSLVDATITALAVSDMFTQDPDTIKANFEEPEDVTPKKKAINKKKK